MRLWIILPWIHWLNTATGLWTEKPSDLVFAKCKELKFQFGDIISFSTKWRLTDPKSQPRHWFFAVSDTELWHIVKESYILPQKGFVDILPSVERISGRRVCVVHPKVPGRPLTGHAGTRLAKRMWKMAVPFETFSCNCHHWADYMAHGRTYGDLYTWHYLPANYACPVHQPFDATTDISSPGFKLAIKDKYGNLQSIEWPRSLSDEQLAQEVKQRRWFSSKVTDELTTLRETWATKVRPFLPAKIPPSAIIPPFMSKSSNGSSFLSRSVSSFSRLASFRRLSQKNSKSSSDRRVKDISEGGPN